MVFRWLLTVKVELKLSSWVMKIVQFFYQSHQFTPLKTNEDNKIILKSIKVEYGETKFIAFIAFFLHFHVHSNALSCFYHAFPDGWSWWLENVTLMKTKLSNMDYDLWIVVYHCPCHQDQLKQSSINLLSIDLQESLLSTFWGVTELIN